MAGYNIPGFEEQKKLTSTSTGAAPGPAAGAGMPAPMGPAPASPGANQGLPGPRNNDAGTGFANLQDVLNANKNESARMNDALTGRAKRLSLVQNDYNKNLADASKQYNDEFAKGVTLDNNADAQYDRDMAEHKRLADLNRQNPGQWFSEVSQSGKNTNDKFTNTFGSGPMTPEHYQMTSPNSLSGYMGGDKYMELQKNIAKAANYGKNLGTINGRASDLHQIYGKQPYTQGGALLDSMLTGGPRMKELSSSFGNLSNILGQDQLAPAPKQTPVDATPSPLQPPAYPGKANSGKDTDDGSYPGNPFDDIFRKRN